LYILVTKTVSTNISLSILVTNVCLMCNANVGVNKKCNAELLIITPKDYIHEYTDSSEIRIHAAQDLKSNLRNR